MQRHFTHVQSGEKTGGDALLLSRVPANPPPPPPFATLYKASARNAGDLGLIPESGISHGKEMATHSSTLA